MTLLRYPIPYQIYAVPKGSRHPREIDVADEVTFEIPDCDDVDAPIVAKVHSEWPSGVFSADNYQRRNNIRPPERPDTEIRSFNGQLYAAVVVDRTAQHKFAVIEDFDEVMGGGLHFATPFSHVYAMRDGATEKRLQAQRAGTLASIEGIPHSKRDLIVEKCVIDRKSVLDTATQDARQYITVNGFIWRKIDKEPVLQYEVHQSGPIKVSLKTPFSSDKKKRVFNLTRLDDLIDHLEVAYPTREIAMEFSELQIFDPTAFKFDDEAETIWTSAHVVLRHLEKQIIEMPEQVAEAWYDLRDDLIETTPKNVSVKAARFAELCAILVEHFKDDPALSIIKHDLDRWDMRPTHRSSGFGR
jgi:hypothetical protein